MPTIIAFLLLSTAWAKPTELQLKVLGADGTPAVTAQVVFAVERDVHLVDGTTGTWTGRALTPPDARAVPFKKGAMAAFRASAPFHQVSEVNYMVLKGSNPVEVALKKLPLPVAACMPAGVDLETTSPEALMAAVDEVMVASRLTLDTPCVLAVRAVARHQQWAKARAELAKGLPEPAGENAYVTRVMAHTAAREWIMGEKAGGEQLAVAQAWCQAVSDLLEPCE